MTFSDVGILKLLLLSTHYFILLRTSVLGNIIFYSTGEKMQPQRRTKGQKEGLLNYYNNF